MRKVITQPDHEPVNSVMQSRRQRLHFRPPKTRRTERLEYEETREPNWWLRQVGWATHLDGLDRKEL